MILNAGAGVGNAEEEEGEETINKGLCGSCSRGEKPRTGNELETSRRNKVHKK